MQMVHTHTPGRSRVNPSRQKEEKSGHKRRANGQNSAEGEGSKRTSRTNLHRETDLTTPRHITEGHGDKVDKLEASPRLQDRALFPRRDGRRSTHKWAWNGYANLHQLVHNFSTSPNNHQEKKDHTWKHQPQASHEKCCWYWCSLLVEKNLFLTVPSISHEHSWKIYKSFQGRLEQRDFAKKVRNGKANCFTIRRRISRLKCVNSGIGSSAFILAKVPSNVSMAPCRTNHGDHTWHGSF